MRIVGGVSHLRKQSMLLKASLALLAIIGVIHLFVGVIYITADEFMPYHSRALMLSWDDLSLNYQTLILASLKLVGAGGLITGMVNLSLVVHTLKNSHTQLVWLIVASSSIFQLTANVVIYSVASNTPAQPPLLAVSIVSVILCFAALLLILDKTLNIPPTTAIADDSSTTL